jgi:endonuclease YncB( thermonuclease family)
MEERSTKFSLLVTGIFLLGLLILAAILKPSRATESSSVSTNGVGKGNAVAPASAPNAVASSQQMLPPPSRDPSALPPVPAPGSSHLADAPSVPEEKARQQILTNCKLKADPSNDGDSFIVMTHSAEYRFSLYFVDAPDLNLGGIEQVRAHSAYFGNLTEEQLRMVARSGKDYITKVLANRTFDVVTRWERAPEESPNHEVTCRAFVYLTAGNGEPTNLATLLVQQGLATVCTSGESLPDSSPSEKFLSDLQRLEQTAIAQKKGAWQYSAGQQNTTQVRYITH